MKLLDKYALDNAQVIIIGNKTDLRLQYEVDCDRHLTKEDGMKAAYCYKVKFMETSAYTNRNILRTIRRMVTLMCSEEKADLPERRKNIK